MNGGPELARLMAVRGIRDERVLAALAAVPRELFVPEQLRRNAYADRALPIGSGQTISQPFMVATMLEALRLDGRPRARDRHGLRLPGGLARGARRRGRDDRARPRARGRGTADARARRVRARRRPGRATARSASPSVRPSTGSSSPPRRRPSRARSTTSSRPAAASSCRSERGATSGSRSSSAGRTGRSASGPCRAASCRCSARKGSTTPASGRASLRARSDGIDVVARSRADAGDPPRRGRERASRRRRAEDPRARGPLRRRREQIPALLDRPPRARTESRSTARSRCSTRASSSSTARTAARSASVPELADARIEADGALVVPLSAQR